MWVVEMIVIMAIVWGGFAWCISKTMKAESSK